MLDTTPRDLDLTPQQPSLPPLPKGARKVELSENSRTVLAKRYLRRGPDGQPIETVEEMFWRVAYYVALAEREWGGDVLAVAQQFYDLLTAKRFFPNSPTFTGAGTPLGQLAACFVLPINDDMGRDPSGIFQTLRDAALIQQTGGGNGFSFSRLRPKGDLVKSSAGQATGPVGFLRVYDRAFGEIAQGGCLVPETLVFTDRGLLSLEELVDPQVPGWQEHDLTVATDEGPRRSPRGYNNGVAPVLEVRTRQGLRLVGTPNHKVKVMTAAGPTWRRLDELEAGDAILVRLGQHRGRLQALRRPSKRYGNQDMPQLPTVLDETLAFLLGYLTGDGFVARGEQDHRVGFSVDENSYLVEALPELLQQVFPGCRVHAWQKSGDRSVTYVVDNRAVKDFLLLNGLAKGPSHKATVPRAIRQSPPEVVGAYLRGLFEADGSVVHGYPCLTTTSRRLAEEVATLLIGLGCPVSVRQQGEASKRLGTRPRWVVRLRSHVALEAWREKIGCDPRSRFVVCYTYRPSLEREQSYVLPCPEWWLQPVLDSITLPQRDPRGLGLGLKIMAKDRRLRRKLLRYLRGDRQLTVSAYRQLQEHHPAFRDNARPVEGLWFLTVDEVVAAGERLTLDLEVDGNHTYLAYGMVTHNTRRGANMAVLRVDHPDIEEFITCKTDENAITNFNISVGITDAFMEAVRRDDWWELRFPDVTAPEYEGFRGTLEQAEAAGIPIRVYKRVRARELFDKIVRQAHHNGEPGVLFLDAANRSNPVPHLYQLEATNPCVTGDTLIYTANGLMRADELARLGLPQGVVVDGRLSDHPVHAASPVFPTGVKEVYRLRTVEGYELRLTADHRVMTTEGWKAARDLRPGDRVHILNRPGGFGPLGSRELGLVLGWLVGDGTVNSVRAVLSFFGAEKAEVAPALAEAVTTVVDGNPAYQRNLTRRYPVGLTHLPERDEVRIQSDRLREVARAYGLDKDRLQVPSVILQGTEETQRAFLQALFTADGSVQDGGEKGCSVRLTSVRYELLQDVQRLLLNFGIASRIYRNRRRAGRRRLPDGRGGYAEYACQAYHELVISRDNLLRFAHRIGFLSPSKQTALVDCLARMRRGPYRETFTARVESVEAEGLEPVYDLTEPATHSFVANGIVVHNCGEQWLGPYENCCLGSVNLAQHVTEDGRVDWEKLRESIELSTRFLDDVVTANKYVPAVPQLKEAGLRARRIGLGIMGLGDMMYRVGVRYGSEEGQEFAAQVMEFVRYHAMRTSIELAKERGPFPAIQGSIYDPDNLKWQPPKPLFPYSRDYGRPPLDWQAIVEGIKAHGIRNAAQTTIAPTGTIATVAGCEGYGCEPVFALAYYRHVNDQGQDLTLTYTSPLFEKALIEAGLDEDTRKRIIEQVIEKGTCQGIPEVPEHIRRVFVVSMDITAEEHVRMQAALQAFVDNSISKCVTGDTLVMTTEGLRPIATLSSFRLPDQFEPRAIDLITPMGVEKSDAFYYGGYRETRRVRFAYGFELEATPNHQIQVLSEQGTVEWRRLDELKPGDTAVLYTGQFSFGPPQQPLPAYTGDFRTSAKRVRFPRHMSTELAFVLGCLVSEGAITRNGVTITNGDRRLLERINRSFERLFDLKGRILQDKRRDSVFTLQINSRPLRRWLVENLGLEAGAPNKTIPLCIWQASREEQAAFLRGLMLDAHVTANGRTWGLTLASRALIRQLQVLLLNFDVVGSVSQVGPRAWAITVAGGELEKLAAVISFEEVWKNVRLANRNRGRRQRFRNYSRLLPRPLTSELRAMQRLSTRSLRSAFGDDAAAYQRARVNLLQGHRLEREDGTQVFQHFAEVATPFAARFFSHDSPRRVYVAVEAIDVGFSEVFDLSVPGSHSFLGNGFGNHNTCNFPADATVEDVAKAYMLAWELGCKGLTVYVTGSRQKVVLETKETAEKKRQREAAQMGMWLEGKKPRPRRVSGCTYKVDTPLGKAFVTINENGDGQPFEVFINTAKAGSETAAVSEAIGRLISYVLRLASPVPPRERMAEVVRQLSGIGGGRPLGFGPGRVLSLPDGVAQVLADYLGETEAQQEEVETGQPEAQAALPLEDAAPPAKAEIGDLCPDCGAASLVNEEGCRKCYTCGYSEC